jgi:hypothetical protein
MQLSAGTTSDPHEPGAIATPGAAAYSATESNAAYLADTERTLLENGVDQVHWFALYSALEAGSPTADLGLLSTGTARRPAKLGPERRCRPTTPSNWSVPSPASRSPAIKPAVRPSSTRPPDPEFTAATAVHQASLTLPGYSVTVIHLYQSPSDVRSQWTN